MRITPKKALELTAQFEGCVLIAYPDPATGGAPWTIGYGHTGSEVRPGLKITRAKAKALLAEDLKVAAAKLRTVVKAEIIDALDDCQYAALLSFVFNVGVGRSWTIWKVLNAGRFDEVPAQFARFVNADGKKMKGLVRRRAAEAALWHEGDAEEVDLPSSVTRSSPTPPTLMDAKPLNQSKSFWAAGVAACAGVSAAIEDVTDAVSPFAWHSETVGRIVSLISLVGAVAAIATVVFLWLKKRRAAQ